MKLNKALNKTKEHLQRYVKGEGEGLPEFSIKTARLYELRLIEFEASQPFAEYADTDLSELDIEVIQAWLDEQGWSPSKQTQFITAIRQIPIVCEIEYIGFLELHAERRNLHVEADDLYSESELTRVIDAPSVMFGCEAAQKRNRAMLTLVIGALCSLVEIRTIRIQDIYCDHVHLCLRPLGSNKLELPMSYMDILHTHIQSISTNYPHTYVLPQHPLFFNPDFWSHPLTEKTVWQVCTNTLDTIVGSKKRQGSGGGLNALRLSAARIRYGKGESEAELLNMLRLTEVGGVDVLKKYLKVVGDDDPLVRWRLKVEARP